MYFADLLTVVLVHLLNFPNIHTMTDDVVVELIAMRYSCQPGSWKLAKRMEVKTIEASHEKINTTKAQ